MGRERFIQSQTSSRCIVASLSVKHGLARNRVQLGSAYPCRDSCSATMAATVLLPLRELADDMAL
ncbi:hypothetical protein IG631_17003 [Alternaria alternata]|nr:hypothetical protein IG631_17003 [Alternaria alternata]